MPLSLRFVMEQITIPEISAASIPLFFFFSSLFPLCFFFHACFSISTHNSVSWEKNWRKIWQIDSDRKKMKKTNKKIKKKSLVTLSPSQHNWFQPIILPFYWRSITIQTKATTIETINSTSNHQQYCVSEIWRKSLCIFTD